MNLLLTISLFVFFTVIFLYLTFEKKIKIFINFLKTHKYILSLEDKVKLVIQDFYKKNQVLYMAGITKIKVRRNRVTIFVLNPGIIIGSKGYLINDLKQTLKSYYGIKYVDIKQVRPFHIKNRKF